MGISIRFFGELMNIELKNKFNYRISIIFLSALTILFGVIGINYRVMGIILVPLIASFLSTLMCVDKKKILSFAVTLILIIYEVYISLKSYITITTIVSLLLAVVISIFFLKGIDKSECALLSTVLISLSILVIAIIYFANAYKLTSIEDIFDRFLIIYEEFKSDVITQVILMAKNSGSTDEIFSTAYLNELFDAYLNCSVALLCIVAFAIVGLTFKIFKALMSILSNEDKILNWDFIPSSVFAYFYLAVAILSLFTTNAESSLAISIVNLYLVFMFVFAYFGYKFINTLLKSKGKKGTTLILPILIVVFSSFAIQVLALIGAYVCINYSKFLKDTNFSNKSNFNG